nr:hypothetical protein Iba_chr02cCG9170 [Ipomoea batatas]
MYSYPLPNAFTDPHIPTPFTIGLHACATSRIAHPVGRKASKLAKISPTVRLKNANKMTRVTMNPMKRNNFRSLNISWKSALNFFLPIVLTFNMIMTTTITSQDRP